MRGSVPSGAADAKCLQYFVIISSGEVFCDNG